MADLGVSGAVASLVKACAERADRVALVDHGRHRAGPAARRARRASSRAARRGRRGFLLQPEWNDGDLFGVTVPNRTIEPLTGVGRGLWCEHGTLPGRPAGRGPHPRPRRRAGPVMSARTPAGRVRSSQPPGASAGRVWSARGRSAPRAAPPSCPCWWSPGRSSPGRCSAPALSRTSVDIGDGLTWFSDSPSGEVIQVNPATGRPETRIDVGGTGQHPRPRPVRRPADRHQPHQRRAGLVRPGQHPHVGPAPGHPWRGHRRAAPRATTSSSSTASAARSRPSTRSAPTRSARSGPRPTGSADAVVDGTGTVWSVNQKGVLSELRWSSSSGSFVSEDERHVDHSGSRSVLVGHDQGVTLFGPDQGIVVQVGTGQDDEVVASAPRPVRRPRRTRLRTRRRWCPSPRPRPGRSRSSPAAPCTRSTSSTIGCDRAGPARVVPGRRSTCPCPGDSQGRPAGRRRAPAPATTSSSPDGGDPALVLDDGKLLINVPGADARRGRARRTARSRRSSGTTTTCPPSQVTPPTRPDRRARDRRRRRRTTTSPTCRACRRPRPSDQPERPLRTTTRRRIRRSARPDRARPVARPAGSSGRPRQRRLILPSQGPPSSPSSAPRVPGVPTPRSPPGPLSRRPAA